MKTLAEEYRDESLKVLNELSEDVVEDYEKEETLFVFEDESLLVVDSFNNRTVKMY